MNTVLDFYLHLLHWASSIFDTLRQEDINLPLVLLQPSHFSAMVFVSPSSSWR